MRLWDEMRPEKLMCVKRVDNDIDVGGRARNGICHVTFPITEVHGAICTDSHSGEGGGGESQKTICEREAP